MMDNKQLEQIKARCEAATPGPWYTERTGANFDGFSLEYFICSVSGNQLVCAQPECGSHPAADRDFIANSREDMPALLAYIDQLKEEKIQQMAIREIWKERASEAEREVGKLRREREQQSRFIRSLGTDTEEGYDIFADQQSDIAQIEQERRRLVDELNGISTERDYYKSEHEKMTDLCAKTMNERDAAIVDLKYLGDCVVCKYNSANCLREDNGHEKCFEWNGLADGED